MSGFEGALFCVPIEDSVATGVAALTIEQNSDNSDTGMAALSGAQATATCAENDDLNGTLLIVDVYKPQERYLQGVLTSGTANIAFGTMTVILYESRTKPTSEHSTISDAALAISPDEA